jgi:high-affinity nickel-transport protein
MIGALPIVFLGFVLGMRHATDADHVIAVATIVSRQRMVTAAAWVGALWGLGHTLTIVAVGVPIIVFNWAVSPRVGMALELGVGVMLIVLGLRNLRGGPATVPHVHGDYVHRHGLGHAHAHAPDDTPLGRLDGAFGGLGVYQAARPVVVGIVHGLAGSAAVALFVLTTIRDARWAVGYLIVFGLGTVAGMVLMTTAIGWPFAGVAGRSAATQRHLRTLTGVLSCGFGLFLVYRIGVVQGLFRGGVM